MPCNLEDPGVRIRDTKKSLSNTQRARSEQAHAPLAAGSVKVDKLFSMDGNAIDVSGRLHEVPKANACVSEVPWAEEGGSW